ncbi:hypothetical protein AB9P05_15700 [Roseivirga sp. BDSF3-8]|uniref:hypothetical protein n=1 Tax=Roseivirga sp. BDSF3-8 TaxID=3241598 RepID=UPI003531FAC8
MIKKTSLYLLICLAGSMLSSCFLFGGNDDDPKPEPIPPIEQLPPLTTEGKGTFGCLVNGEPFVSYYPDALADYSTNDLIEVSADFRNIQASIGIGIRPYEREEMKFDTSRATMQFNIRNDSMVCDYRAWDNIEGWIEVIEFDPFDEFISGTFEYSAVNEECDTVRVTDGRFDLPLVW